MKRFFRIFLLIGGFALLLFIIALIAYGGGREVPLNEKISRASSLIPSQISEKNLTDVVATQLAKEIVEKNPAGPLSAAEGGVVIPKPEEIIDNALREQLRDFDPAELRPLILEKELHIIDNPTKADREKYVTAYIQLLVQRLFNQYITSASPRPEEFLALSGAYKETMADLAAEQVPRDALDIHIQTLELLGLQANAFELIANYKKDPLKAVLAARMQQAIPGEAQELSKKMVFYIEEHSIKK
jgi:hypothetical protein